MNLYESIMKQFDVAHSGYLARTPESQRKLNKKGVQPDIAHARDTMSDLTPAQRDAVNALPLTPAMVERIGSTSNVKVVKRASQIIAFCAGVDARETLKGSARTFAIALAAVSVANARTREGLAWAIARAGSEHASEGDRKSTR